MRYSAPHVRLSARILSARTFGFVLFAVLAAGIAATPFRLTAQEPAPAASAQSSTATGTTAQPAPAKQEQDDDNIYRHTPLVSAIAKAINLPVETTARLFEFINFAIIALAIVIPLVKLVPKILRKRKETLRDHLESARKTTADANARLTAVEARLSKLDDEIAQIRSQVEEESKQDEIRIKATIGEESARIVASAEQEIGVAAAQAKRGLRHFAADLAIEQAAKQLSLSPETDQALIAEFAKDLSASGLNRGGQN